MKEKGQLKSSFPFVTLKETSDIPVIIIKENQDLIAYFISHNFGNTLSSYEHLASLKLQILHHSLKRSHTL